MAAARKLLAEMDKVFRKIDEGVQMFEDIMTKLDEANSENQREKFQDDLKKEIKKLQRLRDQIKGWQNSNEIKDKEKLISYRKKIEEKMEQFKDVERENKTKPHSKQGLSAEDKMDPREREKSDTIKLINTCIERLKATEDIIESEIEKTAAGKTTKKKVDKEKLKKLDDHRKNLDRHLFQIQKLELIMRLLTNDTLQSCDVNDAIKDHIEDYTDADEDDVDLLPEDMYDCLELGNLTEINHQLGNVTNIGTLEETEHIDGTSPSASPPAPKTSGEYGSTAAGDDHPTAGRKERHVSGGATMMSSDVAGAPATGSTATTTSHTQRAVRSLTVGATSSSGLLSRSTPNTPLKLTSQSSVDSPLASPPLSAGIAPSAAAPPLTPTMLLLPYSLAATGQQHQTPQQQQVSGSGGSTHQRSVSLKQPMGVGPDATVRQQRAKTPVITASSSSATAVAATSDLHHHLHYTPEVGAIRGTAAPASAPVSLLAAMTTTRGAPSTGAGDERVLDTRSVSPAVSSVSNDIATTTNSSESASGTSSVPPMSSQQHTATHLNSSYTSTQTQHQSSYAVTNGPASAGAHENGVLSLKSMAEQAIAPAVSGSSYVPPATSSSSAYSPSAMAAVARAAGLPLSALGLVNQTQQQRPPQTACIPPELGASPLGKVDKTSEYQSDLATLDRVSYHLPVPIDTEKVRTYMPRMSYQTPPYYPQAPLPMADTVEFYQRLQPETLFFVFYYMEGTRAQLLAAKALKKQSWRFHKKYTLWFQRHQEPKTITDDYELGTYIYFDIERWQQKKRDDFTFEYKYLEDRHLE